MAPQRRKDGSIPVLAAVRGPRRLPLGAGQDQAFRRHLKVRQTEAGAGGWPGHGGNDLPRDAEALARSLARLLAAPDFAKKLGQNARKHVREHYSLDRLGREINEMYEELVEKKLGGGG